MQALNTHALISPAALSWLQGRSRLLVGLSGGLDSSVLLHALARQPKFAHFQVRAIHVDHGLQPQAEQWSEHCRDYCAQLGIALTLARVDVAQPGDAGPEAAARDARHAAFESALDDDEILVLAHHRDDQAETLLLRALRASGPDGLGAMRPWRGFGGGWLWRPLLDTARSRLHEYAQSHGLQWIDDPSNDSVALDRNFLRHRILPVLRERWPEADAALARSATLSAEASELLTAEDAQALAGVRSDDPHALQVPALLALPATRRARMLRRWIAELDLPPLPSEGIAHIESDLLSAHSDGDAEFAWAQAWVRRWRDCLHADWRSPPLPPDWAQIWDGREALVLPTGDVLLLHGSAGFAEPLQVRARQGGERIALPGRSHTHALKHVLQDLGVPPWLRERMPLLSDREGTLLAAGDSIRAASFDSWLQQHEARLEWNSDRNRAGIAPHPVSHAT